MSLSLNKMTLLDFNNYECPFFVRIAKDKLEDAKNMLPVIEVVDAGINGEVAVVTDTMTQKAFNEAADKLGIITRIRIYK